MLLADFLCFLSEDGSGLPDLGEVGDIGILTRLGDIARSISIAASAAVCSVSDGACTSVVVIWGGGDGNADGLEVRRGTDPGSGANGAGRCPKGGKVAPVVIADDVVDDEGCGGGNGGNGAGREGEERLAGVARPVAGGSGNSNAISSSGSSFFFFFFIFPESGVSGVPITREGNGGGGKLDAGDEAAACAAMWPGVEATGVMECIEGIGGGGMRFETRGDEEM